MNHSRNPERLIAIFKSKEKLAKKTLASEQSLAINLGRQRNQIRALIAALENVATSCAASELASRSEFVQRLILVDAQLNSKIDNAADTLDKAIDDHLRAKLQAEKFYERGKVYTRKIAEDRAAKHAPILTRSYPNFSNPLVGGL